MASALSLKVRDGGISLPCSITSLCSPVEGNRRANCSLAVTAAHGWQTRLQRARFV